ncbi:MAG: SMC-Scp complex subunit ScpB [Clostridia bacterium]|nr:SMC-Scp complex subunit ScpB [Clostridia bacterium]
MESKQYKAAIEAILFASGEPVELDRLAEAVEMEKNIIKAVADDLVEDYRKRGGGIIIVKLDDAYQMCSARDYASYVRRAMDLRRNTPLSQAAMEVLAIIAYNQPVTRSRIEQVRGVDCSAVMQGLMLKGLIEERGRLEMPGRPLLYGTTKHFLRCFSMESLEDLPPLPQSAEEKGEVDAMPEYPAEPTLEDLIDDQPAEEETV